MAKALAQFTITRSSEGEYVLHLEDEDGETTDFTADFEQLDLISEAIEEQLEADDDELMAADDEDEDEKDEDED